jgi:hypothetical protein
MAREEFLTKRIAERGEEIYRLRETIDDILDRRIREVSAKSADAKRAGNDAEMYKMNTAYHWLDAVRRDLDAALSNSEER